MSFSLQDFLGWVQAGDSKVELLRADGSRMDRLAAPLAFTRATLDSREAGEGILFCGVAGEKTHGGRYLALALAAGSDAALIEAPFQAVPGSTRPVIVVRDARGALRAAAEGWLAQHQPDVVGITGSNGKTTTKDMLRAALATGRRVGANPGNLNSGWGLPLAVLGQPGDIEVLVLEMGASAPDEIGRLASMARPRVGCITNVAPAHLEQFGTEDEVERTKGQLIEALPADGLAVLNRDDARHDRLAARSAAPVVSFGRDPRADVRLEDCEQLADGLRVRIDGVEAKLPVFGEVNGWNAAAAVALARAFGVDAAPALDGIAASALSPHRSRLVRHAGRVLLDDCYNANPASVRRALQSLAALPGEGRKFAVLGDMAELGPESHRHHLEILELALSFDVDAVHLPGPKMRAAAADLDTPHIHLHDGAPDELATILARESKRGDALLFKGSRSAALEHVLEALIQRLDRDAAAAAGEDD